MKSGENRSSGLIEKDIYILDNFIHVYSRAERADTPKDKILIVNNVFYFNHTSYFFTYQSLTY